MKTSIQRYRCKDCSLTFSELRHKPLGAHSLEQRKAITALSLLLEGMSIRATSRLTGVHKNTILSLILTVGESCRKVLNAKMTNLSPRFVQVDEAWGYIYCKRRNLTEKSHPDWGDIYLWIALDSETKTVISYHLGKRDSEHALEFIQDLGNRTNHGYQLTSDGLDSYVGTVDEVFGCDIHFPQLIKIFGKAKSDGPDWYRPSKFVTTIPTPLRGRPNKKKISTTHVERFNLTLRTHLRRFTRLCNGFSKSKKHLEAMVAIFIAWYNFCRQHQSLRVSPCMEMGVTDHLWTLEEILMAATQI
jgi:IS1 family transposase